MPELKPVIFACDVPGCRSWCDLGAAVLPADRGVALECRGWDVRDAPGTADGTKQYLCPSHHGDWTKIPTTFAAPPAEPELEEDEE